VGEMRRVSGRFDRVGGFSPT